MYNEEIREKVRQLYNVHKNYSKVAENLLMPESSVQFIVKHNYENLKQKRRPQFKLKSRDLTRIKPEVRRLNSVGEKVTAKKIKETLRIPVSRWTIARALKRLKFTYEKVKKNIVLTKQHKKRRYELAEHWISSSHPWNRTVFSDEKKFNFDGPDSWCSWMDSNHKCSRNRRQMGGGSVMVWAGLLPNGHIIIKRLIGRYDSKKYIDFLSTHVKSKLDDELGEENYIFQQDNASIHTSAYAMTWLPNNFPQILEWESIEEACNQLMAEKRDTLIGLIRNVPKRLLDVIRKKGTLTKY